MILFCSNGHTYNTESVSDRWWKGDGKEPGMTCNQILNYDRMGSTYCGCKLYELEERVEYHFDRCITKYVSPKRYEELIDKGYIPNYAPFPVKENMKDWIRKKLLEGGKIISGYLATEIRDYHDSILLIKKKEDNND